MWQEIVEVWRDHGKLKCGGRLRELSEVLSATILSYQILRGVVDMRWVLSMIVGRREFYRIL